jgi:hypothetical protein
MLIGAICTIAFHAKHHSINYSGTSSLGIEEAFQVLELAHIIITTGTYE